jgi:glycosyltransferase involved in cell wall biosynthesis
VKLLLAIPELGVGGAERVVVELARDAMARGDEVAVAAAPGPLERDLEPLGVERYALPAPSRAPLNIAVSLARLTAAVRRFGPDLVHAHNPKIAALATIAALAAHPRACPPLVATSHGVPPSEARLAARLVRGSRRLACVSSQVAEEAIANGVPPERVTVIHNSVPSAPALTASDGARLDQQLGLDGRPVVTTIGRLVPQKAHGRLLDAAAIVRQRVPDVLFLIVGDGPLRSELEQRSREGGLDETVRFTGVRHDARAIAGRSDLVVFSSDWEGLSLAALEALAAGVPVVSTDVAGTAEALATGAGLVVSRSAEALAGAIVELLEDPDRRRGMGEEGRRLHAERFSTETMVAAYRALYASAADP